MSDVRSTSDAKCAECGESAGVMVYELGGRITPAPTEDVQHFIHMASGHEWYIPLPGNGVAIRPVTGDGILGLRGWRIRGAFCHLCELSPEFAAIIEQRLGGREV